jgi:hypothetical protein
VRGGDLRAVKLLLDYEADPKAVIRYSESDQRSLLAIAVFNGFADIVKMLLESGAEVHPNGLPPLLASFNHDERDVLAVLLEGRLEDVLLEFDHKPFLVHAIERQSNLLPVIARCVILATEKLPAERRRQLTPKGLTRKQEKMLKKALKLQDEELTTEFVTASVHAVKRPWKKLTARQAIRNAVSQAASQIEPGAIPPHESHVDAPFESEGDPEDEPRPAVFPEHEEALEPFDEVEDVPVRPQRVPQLA